MARPYKPGDILFWNGQNRTSAGEAMFIGYASDNGDLVCQVGLSAVRFSPEDCVPTGRGEPPLGQSFRDTYLKRNPGGLR